jgi:hypothetical protein
MAINIQDNFRLNIALPVDTRIVASGSTARNNIQFKYDGLTVFDTSDRKTYIYNSASGTFSTNDSGGSGTLHSLTKWSSTTGLTSSGVFFRTGTGLESGKVGINTSNPLALLHIVGDGGGATQFVVHGYSTGVLIGQNFYNNGSNQYTDIAIGSAAIRMDTTSDIDFLVRPFGRSQALDITGTSDTVMKIEGNGNQILFKKNILMYYPAGSSVSQGSLFLRAQQGFSTKQLPDLTWWYNDKCGFFHPAQDVIGIAIGGDTQFGRFTPSGFLIASDQFITTPNYKIHIDSGNTQQSYIQFTQGATTGVGSSTGVLMGITTEGNAAIFSRYNTSAERGILFGFSGTSVHHKFNRRSHTIYAATNGVTPTVANGTGGHRVIRATKVVDVISTSPFTVETLTVPSNSQVVIEATFVLSESSGPSFRTQKIISHFTVNSAGAILLQNTGTTTPGVSGQSLATLTSTLTSKIGAPTFTTSANTINFRVLFGGGFTSGSSVVSYTAVINTTTGH